MFDLYPLTLISQEFTSTIILIGGIIGLQLTLHK
jgi:hypothetical protein